MLIQRPLTPGFGKEFCRLRKFAHCVRKELWNRQSTSFWHDSWHPWGVLNITHQLRRKLIISDDAKVSTVLDGHSWRLTYGRGWDNQVVLFSQACNSIHVKTRRWSLDLETKPCLLCLKATIALQPSLPLVDWEKFVWCNHFLPRYAIILWLACWTRMNTLDKLFN